MAWHKAIAHFKETTISDENCMGGLLRMTTKSVCMPFPHKWNI